jgi:hypothetical protein
MATSGSLLGDTVEGSENSYLDWQLVSQSIANNTSTINWQAGWRFDDYSCRGLRKGSAVVNGTTVWNDQDPGDGVHAFNSGHEHRGGTNKLQCASGTRVIAHASNGTKTFSGSIDLTGYNGQRSNGSTSWALPTIPRNPNAPVSLLLSEVKQISVKFSWAANPADGLPNTSYTISYGTTTSADTFTTTSSVTNKTIIGLTPGVKYYFKVRAVNSVGTGPYSSIINTTTIAGARVNVAGVWKTAVPYVRDGGVWKVARPWVKVLGVWKETI